MKQCIGTTIADVVHLKSDNEFVRLPGSIRIGNPDMGDRELFDAVMNGDPIEIGEKVEQACEWYKKEIEERGIGDGLKFSFGVNPLGDTLVYAGGFSFRKRVKMRLKELMRELDEVEDDEDLEEVMQSIPKHTGSSSERTTIYQVSKMFNFPVYVNETTNHWQVTPKVVGVKSKATRVPGQRQTVLKWLLGLPLCEPTTMPREIVENVSDTYLRVILADKSVPYYFSYRKGKVTKYKAALRDGNLYVSGKCVGPCDNRALLELLLIPYALEPKDVLNPKAPRTGSDTSCETLVDAG